jgi:hypothetical protein
MTRRLAATALILLGACTAPADPNPQIAFFPTKDQGLDLPASGWRDDDIRWTTVSVLNTTWFPFQLEEVRLSGSGATFLEVQAPGGDAGATLGVRESLPIKVRVKPPGGTERSRWSSGDYEAKLSFSTRGTGKVAATGEPDPTDVRIDPYEIPIRFRLDCDLDGDGADADACGGGTDCDDELTAIGPAADEVCDGIDNDCSGEADENCD